jgi:hypothetical protein
MSRIKVRRAQRPNLTKSGVLTFMSPGGHGLACLARTCPTPTCACRSIFLEAVPIDFRVESVAFSRGKLSFYTRRLGGLEPAADSESWIAARLNPDTGELHVETERNQCAEAEEYLAPLRDALDGELLDDFARLWLRLKGLPAISDEPLGDADLGEWKPGETLAFGQVFAELRADGYPVGDRIYEVVDLHCPDPDCDCSEVTLVFVDPAGRGVDAGAVRVDLSSDDVSFDHDTDDETLVPGLWKRFVHRHRGISLLLDRQKRMKEFGKTLPGLLEDPPDNLAPSPITTHPEEATGGQRRDGTRTGRNEPCPCGSGKKYKKCCMPRVLP